MGNYCLGNDCPDKRCEICSAKHQIFVPENDEYKTHASISPSGYYSSGRIVRIKEKGGKIRYFYADYNSGD